ncbi:MAG: hypothetical protein GY930_13235 [bacterium]|nr:hypothetical protein [bacterium]
MFEDESRVLYKRNARVQEVAARLVKEVVSVESRVHDFLAEYEAVDRRSIEELRDLAIWAEKNRLPGEARNIWLRILLLDGHNEQAWKRVGGRRMKGGLGLRLGNKVFSLAEFKDSGRDWRYAIEIPTAHFLVKTNANLGKALNLAIELEAIYQIYAERIGHPIELFPFEWVPEIRIDGGGKRAPQAPVTGIDAWFDNKSNVLMVYGNKARTYHVWRAAMDMVIHNSFRMALGNRAGTLPVWAHEGLANGFVLGLRNTPRGLEFKQGIPHMDWFRAQAEMKEPLSIRRVFSSSQSDYGGGTNQLGYRAGAYTLVFFLMNGEDKKHREHFFDYLRSAFHGKGSLSTFGKAFPMDVETLSSEWFEFTRKTAHI